MGPVDKTIDLILRLARRRVCALPGSKIPGLTAPELAGQTIGIIGFGRVGQAVARRARFELGMQVVIHTRRPVPVATLARLGARQVARIEDVLEVADVVSLHCNAGPGNRHIIDAPRLDLMKEEAVLVNTACARLVDQTALAQSLMFDMIGGVAMDHFDGTRIDSVLAHCDGLLRADAPTRPTLTLVA
ncbi:2-hydroxyacid dehydrogenase [Gymnodinialimonas hymeniacidonis]|uniref:2-hydroxyacid dehydrogenase n=1 Tax=Gymnodinialimonas hymeniacidonis TaxID=3126508 RepID=UPI0034C634E3